MKQRFLIDPSLSDEEIADRLNRMGKAKQIAKHAAPIHPGTGTGQEVHRGGGVDPSEYQRYAELSKPKKVTPTDCYRCGGAGGYQHWPGFTCFRCGGDGIDPKHKDWGYPIDWTDDQVVEHQEKLADRNAKARARRQAKAEAEAEEQMKANLAKYPELGPAYERYKEGEFATLYDEDDQYQVIQEGDSFLQDVLGKVTRYDLSEKQVAAVVRGLERYDEFNAKQAVQDAKTAAQVAANPFPSGEKRTVTGRIVSAKWQESQYGSTLKMLVETPEGWRIWGTVPKSVQRQIDDIRQPYDEDGAPNRDARPFLEVLKDQEVEFTATLEASKDDPQFGFFSRPTQATIRKQRIAKHPGSDGGDIHDTGTDQSIHGSSRVHTTRGVGDRKGTPVDKFLVDANGRELPLSHSAIQGDIFMMIDGKRRKVSAKKVAEVHEKILNVARDLGFDPDDMDDNLARILDSAYARYKDNPSLIDEDKFYEGWHEALFKLSEKYDIEFSRVIASAAAVSPGTNAPANLHYAADLAEFVSDSKLVWEGDEVDEVIKVLEVSADDILNPVYMKEHEEVKSGKKKEGDPRKKPKEGGARWQEGQRILADARRLAEADSISLNDLTSDGAARVLHWHRAQVGGQQVDAPGFLAGKTPQGGFGVSKGYANYAKAISVLRGWDYDGEGNRFEVSVSDVLGDIKVRAFHNNILDPTDSLGFGDVTVDFHTVNGLFFTLGGDKNTSFVGTPDFEGVSLGVRPLVADVIRRAASEELPPSRVQEIMWAEWKRGLTTAGNLPEGVDKPDWWFQGKQDTGTITHWQAYDGTYYELPNIDPKVGAYGDAEAEDE